MRKTSGILAVLTLLWVLGEDRWPAVQVLSLMGFVFGLQFFAGLWGWRYIHDLTGGEWFEVFKAHSFPKMKTFGSLLFLFAVFFGFAVVSPLGESLYAWRRPVDLQHHPHWIHKVEYFKMSWVLIRTVIYLGVFMIGIFFYDRLSPWAKGAFAAGLFISLTWIGMDYVMSLDLSWHSSIFGAHIALQSLTVALSAVLLPPFSMKTASVRKRRDWGNLLLVMVMLWGYFHLSQYLIIWAAQIPFEEKWFRLRFEGEFMILTYLMLIFGFVLPFFLLLFRRVKESEKGLVSIAVLLLISRFWEWQWMIFPSVSEISTPLIWSLFFVSFVLFWTLTAQQRRSDV